MDSQLQHDVVTVLCLIEVLSLYETRLQERRRGEEEERRRRSCRLVIKEQSVSVSESLLRWCQTHVVDPLEDLNLCLCVSYRRL